MTYAATRLRALSRARLVREGQRPRLWITIRTIAGVWLLALTALLYAYGVGGWWGVLLVPAGALHLYWAFLLSREVPERDSK